MRRTRHNATAFSLLELIIIVAIIGTIAALAVPRISRGARDTADSSLHSSLAQLRSAIDLYAAEHNGQFPAADSNDPNVFVAQLTRKTDASGRPGHGPEFVYGPYLTDGIPPLSVGPNRGAKGVRVEPTGPTVLEEERTIGWVYNSTTGLLIANTDDPDEHGTPYYLY